MKILKAFFVVLGIALLVLAAVLRFNIGKPYSLLGVRALSLVALANTAFILAIFLKLSEKK